MRDSEAVSAFKWSVLAIRGRAQSWAVAAVVATPLLWLAVGIALNAPVPFRNSSLLDWNIVEVDIASNLIRGWGYVVDPLSPPAVWRPPLISLLTIPMLFVTNNPIAIFVALYLASIASLCIFMFLTANLLFGRVAAHLAGLFAVTTPALGSMLAMHSHGFSHIGFMILVGPTIYFSIRAIRFHEWKSSGWAGLLCGMLVLARPEAPIIAVAAFAMLVISSRERPARTTALLCGLFALACATTVLPYEVMKRSAVKSYGLFPSPSVANFYASEGWIRPPKTLGEDVEGQGWVRAIAKYGRPEENSYSLLNTIRRNIPEFRDRLGMNFQWFMVFAEGGYLFDHHLVLFLLFLPLMRIKPTTGPELAYLFLCSLSPLVCVAFHVSDRYLSPMFPFLMLLIAGGIGAFATRAAQWRLLSRLKNVWGASILGSLIFAFLFVQSYPLLRLNRADRFAFSDREEILGRYFSASIGARSSTPSVLDVLDGLKEGPLGDVVNIKLLSFFAHTSINWRFGDASSLVGSGVPNGVYPRDAIFSMTEKRVDYYFIESTRLAGDDVVRLHLAPAAPAPVWTSFNRRYFLFAAN
jgi:hypothetical protein